MDQGQIIAEILGDDITKNIVVDLGLANESPAKQVELITAVGKQIFSRVVLELLKAIQPAMHEKFNSFVGSGDLVGLREFLSPYIPNLDEFIREHAQKEYQTIKARVG